MNSKTILIALFSCFFLVANGQEDTLIAKKSPVLFADDDDKKNLNTRWLVMDLGMALYLGEDGLPKGGDDFQLRPGRSVNVNIYLFQQRVNLVKHKLNLIYGLGFSLYSYNLKQNIVLQPNAPHLNFFRDSSNVRKNKLRTNFFHIPLLLNYKVKPKNFKKSLQFSAGVYGEVLATASTKRKGDFGKVKERDDFNLNKFRYGLRGEIGYGGLNFYVSYSLKSLFKEEESPVLYPLSVGVKVIPF